MADLLTGGPVGVIARSCAAGSHVVFFVSGRSEGGSHVGDRSGRPRGIDVAAYLPSLSRPVNSRSQTASPLMAPQRMETTSGVDLKLDNEDSLPGRISSGVL